MNFDKLFFSLLSEKGCKIFSPKKHSIETEKIVVSKKII